ncbi:MAG: hypothetical protein ACFE8O_12430 [Candidatus Hermodarchaeota archaeon]
MRSNSIKKFNPYSILLLILVLAACGRGDVPLPTFPTAETFVVSTEIEPTSTTMPVISEKYPLQVEYAAVWVLNEDGLSIRSQAGISDTVAKVIPWDSRQIYLTGNRSLLGSSLWLEIEIDDGTTGWVSAWNLTEYIPSDLFCNDSRAKLLIDEFIQALQDPQNSSLNEFISPNRGLTIRLNWYSPDVIFAMDEIDSISTDDREIEWGIMADSGLQITGTFEKIIRPYLEDVFSDSSEVICNELKWGNTSGEILWPNELENLNFFSFYRKAEEDGNLFDWRTWAIGIEYVNNQPYIAILIHYSSEL